MQTEKIKMLAKQEQQITDMLHSQGLTKSEIDVILKGEYASFKTDLELTNLFSLDGNYQNVLRGLADGYSINELQQIGINLAEIEEFNKTLQKCNLTVENAKAINQYSNDSNMILAMKRGLADKTKIQDELKNEMISKLQSRGLSNEKIISIEEYIGKLDFDKPIHENYKIISKYMKEIDIPHNCYSSICTAIKDRDLLIHIEETLSSLDEGLSKARLPESIKLYRAIKTSEKVDFSEYIGKSISSDGYTSTSPLYDASFAKYDDYDTVMEIYAPKGTQGSYMSQLSDYDSVEHEILLNPNDIHIIDVQDGVVDKNGRTKTILKGLLLSKDKECYKGIDIKKEEAEILSVSESYNDQVTKNNLPVKQGKFSNFFNQVRSRFLKKGKKSFKNKINEEEKRINTQSEIQQTSSKEQMQFEKDLKENVRTLDEIVETSEKYEIQDEKVLQGNTYKYENNDFSI